MNIDRYIKLIVIVLSVFIALFAQTEQGQNNQQENQGEVQEEEQSLQGENEEAVNDQGEGEAQEGEQGLKVDKEGAVKISNITINNFENADRWFGSMSIDNGLIQVEKRKGAAKEIREANPDQAKFVLGAKVSFFKAGIFEAAIEPPSPVIIHGYTKKLSVWAYGKGNRHTLYAVVRDFKGRLYKFTFGRLDFFGWKKMEVAIPSDPAYPFFSQTDHTRETFFQTHGITFVGFLIEFDPKESRGRFYVYLDNFEAESNIHLYEKELQIANTPEDERLEPIDNW